MLKYVAIALMFLDHVGHFFIPFMPEWLYWTLRMVGRLAYPIFAYEIARGMRRTRNLPKYTLRLLLFAGFSEIIIRYAMKLARYPYDDTNVLFTFVCAIVFILAFVGVRETLRDLWGVTELSEGEAFSNFQVLKSFQALYQVNSFLRLGLWTSVGALALFLVWKIRADYAIYGVLMVFVFFLAEEVEIPRQRRITAFIGLTALNIAAYCISVYLPKVNYDFNPIQVLSILSLLVIALCPEAKSKPSTFSRYFFYFFYPLHLLALAAISHFLR